MNKLPIPFFALFLFAFVLSLSAQIINPDLQNNKWQASWISHPYASEKGYEVLQFRKSFILASLTEKFVINISADNRYWLFVNGERVCTGPAKGDVAHWRFETVDIAKYLSSGKNTIAVQVWNLGEYAGWAQLSYKTGLVIQGNTQFENLVNTDESWKVYQSNAYFPLNDDHRVIGARELFFMPKYTFGWEKPEYDDSKWLIAIKTEDAIPANPNLQSNRKLVQRNLPFPEETMQRFASIRELTGVEKNEGFLKRKGKLTVNPWAKATILIDQNYLTTAYPELLISGGKGAKITLKYMEAPFENVKEERKGNRHEVAGKIRDGIFDVIYLDGEANRWYRPLTYRTFRYIELTIEAYLEPVEIEDFYSKFTAYPFQENASFTCSDTSIKSIWNTSWRTARLCAFETYMDCPYYEQLQYVGDTRIQALISLYVSGDERLMKNAINQYADSRTDEGLTQSRYPNNLKQIIPPFSLFWAIMVHDFWWHKSDDAFVKSHLKGIQEVLAWHINKIDPKTNMLGSLPHWNFVDWPKQWPWLGQDKGSGEPQGDLSKGSAIHTLQLVYALEKSAALFYAFGMKKEALTYNEVALKLKQATKALCWDTKKMMMADLPDKSEYSQHANTLAVLTNTIEGEAARALMQKTITDKTIVQCTVYYRFYLNQAMKKAGLGDKYIEMLTPWRDMLKIGLTTFAEKPEPSRSDCHGWSASPNYDLLATVLGIEPSAAAFKTVKIAPNLGELTYAEGKMPHPNGEIKVSLKRNGKYGISAIISLPENTNGNFHWNGKDFPLKPGLQDLEL